MKKILILLPILFIFLVRNGLAAQAQGQTVPLGTITINPAFAELTLKQAQNDLQYDIKITNTTKTTIKLEALAVDLKGLDETGGLLFAGSTGGDFVKKYGIANWITIEPKDVTIIPGSSKAVKITISNRSDLSPGGHYGTILFRTTQVEKPRTEAQVSINPSLSSLIFLGKIGGERYDLSFRSITSNRRLWKLPDKVDVTFHNPGNTHNKPRGLVQVVGPLGKVVADGTVNSESGFVLPQTARKFVVNLKPLSRVLLPGKYKLRVIYHYDGLETTTTHETKFLFISPTHILAAFVVVVLLILVIKKYLPKKYKLHRRKH